MILPIFYIFRKAVKSTLDYIDVILVMALQGLGFAFFSSMSDPQYLLASLPFLLILCLIEKRLLPIILVYFSTLLGIIMVAFVTPYNFNQYFVDVNKNAASIQLFIPSLAISLISILYSISGVFVFLSIFNVIKGRTKPLKLNNLKFFGKKLILASAFILVIFSLFTIAIIAPGLNDLPSEFSYQENASITPLKLNDVTHSNNGLSFTFNLPNSWNLVPEKIKNNTSNGIYIKLPSQIEQVGVIARNGAFPFNSSHFVFENFSITTEGLITNMIFGFINNSYLNSQILLIKGNIFTNDHSIIDSFLGKYYSPTLYDTYPKLQNEYVIEYNASQIITPGNYTLLIKGLSSNNSYLGGWNGDPSKQGVTNIGVIGPNKTITSGKPLENMRISMSITIVLNTTLFVMVNGHEFYKSDSNFNCSIIKIPNNYLEAKNLIQINYNLSKLPGNNTPSIFYFNPFPNYGNLSLLNMDSFFIGGLFFLSLTVIFIFVMRRIIISIHYRGQNEESNL